MKIVCVGGGRLHTKHFSFYIEQFSKRQQQLKFQLIPTLSPKFWIVLSTLPISQSLNHTEKQATKGMTCSRIFFLGLGSFPVLENILTECLAQFCVSLMPCIYQKYVLAVSKFNQKKNQKPTPHCLRVCCRFTICESPWSSETHTGRTVFPAPKFYNHAAGCACPGSSSHVLPLSVLTANQRVGATITFPFWR